MTREAATPATTPAIERHPALTVLGHPQARRIGDRATLLGLAAREAIALSRIEPNFSAVGAKRTPEPLADPFLSRRAIATLTSRDGNVVVERAHPNAVLRFDGDNVADVRTVSPADLERGVVLEVGDRVVLLLHWVEAVRSKPPPRFDLVGDSDVLDRLRREIARVANTDLRVLLRGGTGTGKELAARAVHAASARRAGPYEAVNMATLVPSLAASALFGHVRGAFSGAVTDHDGHFAMANGGTLFLDEIADTEQSVQPMLLRALETHEFQRVGDRHVRKADVRLVSATDANLEAAVAAGRFREPLLHRVAEAVLVVPALRERRDDIGRLMVHFMREVLDADEQSRLLDGPIAERPWLSAPVIARLARTAWTGNVRQLRNAVRQLAVLHRGEESLALGAGMEAILGEATSDVAASSSDEPETPAKRAPASDGKARRPHEITDDEILDALEATGYRRAKAAERLGIARSSLYARIAESPLISRSQSLSEAEIQAASARAKGDLPAMADELRVSPHGLKLRMRALKLV